MTTWLQVHGTETGESIFVGVSYFGSEILTALLVIVGVVLVVRRDWRHVVMLAVTCGGGEVLNTALKAIYHRARPTYAAEFNPASWSFPSGHAMDSLIVYGLFAYWLSRTRRVARVPLFAGAALIVGSIGYARIYLGVHYLSDVIAGYLAGIVWLVVCVSGYQFAEARRVGPAGPDETPKAPNQEAEAPIPSASRPSPPDWPSQGFAVQ